jgi:hypothetical protein
LQLEGLLLLAQRLLFDLLRCLMPHWQEKWGINIHQVSHMSQPFLQGSCPASELACILAEAM